MRMNILHLLDSLCETALTTDSRKSSANPSDRLSYTGFVARDLEKIIQLVVPDTRDGLINLMSTRQVSRRPVHHDSSR
jgi:CTD kinase subunit gamma